MKRLLFCLYLFNALSAIAGPTELASIVHRDVDRLVALYTDGFAYSSSKMRQVTFGSLFDTQSEDAVAFFSLGGVDNSNITFEYIAIFARGKGRDFSDVKGPKDRPYYLVATALVGSRGTRTLDWGTVKIGKGQIVVKGTRWAEGDARCCPTKPIEVTFSIPAELTDGLASKQYPILRESERPGNISPRN